MGKSLGTLTGLLLCTVAASPLSGQGRETGIRFEAGAVVVVPTRALPEGQGGWMQLKSAPLITGAGVLRSGSSLAFRVRAGAALTTGTARLIRSGPGPRKLVASNGRAFLALGEVLIAFKDRPNAELAVGIGARRYQLGQSLCPGAPCGGSRSDTDLTGSLSISVGARLGSMKLGLEAGSLLSRYRGRAMFDLLFGARVRF